MDHVTDYSNAAQPNFAPPEVLEAALFTLQYACIYTRNITIAPRVADQQVNSLMEAIHEVPLFLTNWSDERLDELRLHLSCFDHSKWPDSPDLLGIFDRRLASNNKEG